MSEQPLTRQQIAAAVDPLGWRLVRGAVATTVRVPALADGVRLAGVVVTAAGEDAQGHLDIDLRADRMTLRLMSADAGAVTRADLRLAGQLSAALRDAEAPNTVGPDDLGAVQAFEIAIDALDIAAVRPFWRAITGYVDHTGPSDLDHPLVDPVGRGPALWFQQMDAPRGGRNRVHLDVDVVPDLVQQRLDAAVAAGGRVVSDTAAPAFWVLADPEGNEACLCTWQGRD